jgi:hypothetical protein
VKIAVRACWRVGHVARSSNSFLRVGKKRFTRGIIEAGSWLASTGAGAVPDEDADVRGTQILTGFKGPNGE